jgi:integrase
MPRELIPGDLTIRAIKPGDSRKRLPDGDGLYLLLFVNGGAHGWRFDYSINGRRKTISLGTYPDTGLALARRKADDARRLVREGVDPSAARQEARSTAMQLLQEERRQAEGKPAPDSFEGVAREWFETRRTGWSAGYADKVIARLVADVFPYIGRSRVSAVTPPQLLEVLRRIEGRGVVETAHRAHESCSQVFRYAVGEGLATSDPARDLKGQLRKPQPRHFPAILEPARLAELLRACDGYKGTPVVRAALRLAPLLLLRPGELRHTRWKELDLDAGRLVVPPERMKRERDGKLHGAPHLVPLARQAVEVLQDLQQLTGGGELVFRGERHHHRPMSDNTVNAALRAMGFPADEVVCHGFRATARTLLAERLNYPDAVIEAQLAHAVGDSLGRAYNRTEFVAQRVAMMQAWADWLDDLKAKG